MLYCDDIISAIVGKSCLAVKDWCDFLHRNCDLKSQIGHYVGISSGTHRILAYCKKYWRISGFEWGPVPSEDGFKNKTHNIIPLSFIFN